MVGALENQLVSTSNLTKVVATQAAQMIPYVGANVEARTVIVDLINNALGPGTVSLQTLNTWVGKNSVSLGQMNAIVATSTINASALGLALTDNLNTALSQSIIDAEGGGKALSTFATDLYSGDTANQAFYKSGQQVIAMLLQQSGNSVPKAQLAFEQYTGALGLNKSQADALWNDITARGIPSLNQMGVSALGLKNNSLAPLGVGIDTTAGKVANLSKYLLAVPKSITSQVTVHGSGTGGINIVPTPSGLPSGNAAFTTLAQGGLIRMGSGPTADDVPILASKGETVVSAADSKKLAPAFRAIGVPGYAYGGITGSKLPSLPGWAGGIAAADAGDIEVAFAKAMIAKIQAAYNAKATAAAAAAISTGGIGLTGVSNSSAVAALQSAAAKKGWTGAQWQDLVNVEMREAGFNLTATNPSSGAYGMAQFINGPSEYYQYGGNPNTAAGQAVAMVNYIACVPLDGRILTRAGWKTYSQVKVGDETVGYDQATGKSAWTKVTAVHHYESGPVTRLSSNRVNLRSTPNHRWLTEKSIQTGKATYRREEFTETQHISTRHRIRLAAPHDDQDGLPITLVEAELLGWIAGDGHVSYPSPKSVSASVFQSESKPKQLASLRVLLEGSPHTEYTRPPVSGRASIHQFRLRSPYVRDLFNRSGYEGDLELMVLRMSAEQRAAFIAGLLEADGYLRPESNGRRGRPGGTWIFCQNDGPVLRAFMLAAYLSGYWCNATDSAGQKHITLGSPYVGSGSGFHREDLDEQPVWCVTTELGSWTVEQSGQVFLTGNSRYGNPANAWAHELAYGWYKAGGLIPGMAAGGTVAGLRATLAAEQAGERSHYFGFEHSYAIGPAKYRTARTMKDLATLASDQGYETRAYAALAGSGLTTSNLRWLGSQARDVLSTTNDADLSKAASAGGHPVWRADLRKYLSQIIATSAGTVPGVVSTGGKTGGGGTGPPVVSGGGTSGGTTGTSGGSTGSTSTGSTSTTAPVTVTSITNPLTADLPLITAAFMSFLNDINAFAADLTTIAPGGTGTGATAAAGSLPRITKVYGGSGGVLSADLNAILGNLSGVASQPLTVTMSDGTTTTEANPLATEVPVVTSSFRSFLADVSAALAGSAPGTAGTSSISADVASLLKDLRAASMPAMAMGGRVSSYDKGGYLPPGMSMAWNGTGSPEPVGAAGQKIDVTISFDASAAAALTPQMLRAIKYEVRTRGGGSVQKAFGNHEVS